MEKKYDGPEIIKIVDKAFINFEEMLKSGKSEQKINDDSHFDVLLMMMKFAIMGEIMSLLKEEKEMPIQVW